ncbi:MAG: DotU family type IV/VI secretion system protein, partial [Thermoanaerobaculia bacterium]
DLEGMEKLKHLIGDLVRRLQAARSPAAEGLSPAWKPPDQKPKLAKDCPAWVVAVACAAGILVVYMILAAALGGITGGLLKGLGPGSGSDG